MNVNLSKSVEIDILEHPFTVGFPVTGQFLDIQVIKSKLTEGYYDMFKGLERDGLMANIFVDMIATYNVMIGKDKLKEKLTVDSLLQLPLQQIVQMALVFKDKYVPFYEGWMNAISNPKKEEEVTS